MRSSFQIRVRYKRAKLANELLQWLKEKNLASGRKAYELVIIPFAIEKKLPSFEVWKAWDLLKESKNRVGRPGSFFQVDSFEPLSLDAEGNIINK